MICFKAKRDARSRQCKSKKQEDDSSSETSDSFEEEDKPNSRAATASCRVLKRPPSKTSPEINKRGRKARKTKQSQNQTSNKSGNLSFGTRVEMWNYQARKWDKVGEIAFSDPSLSVCTVICDGESYIQNKDDLRPLEGNRDEPDPDRSPTVRQH